jgi:hypothetical protein
MDKCIFWSSQPRYHTFAKLKHCSVSEHGRGSGTGRCGNANSDDKPEEEDQILPQTMPIESPPHSAQSRGLSTVTSAAYSTLQVARKLRSPSLSRLQTYNIG